MWPAVGPGGWRGSAGAHERGSVPGVAAQAVGNGRAVERQSCLGLSPLAGGDHKKYVTFILIAKSKWTAEAAYSLAIWLSCAGLETIRTGKTTL